MAIMVRILVVCFLSFLICVRVHAGLKPPNSLQGVKIPKVPELRHYVTDQQAAIQLGKALFWDMNVGSDGTACGSCHFHAGADHRMRNQLEPGGRHGGSPRAHSFEILPSGTWAAPGITLKSDDFPLWQFTDANNRDSGVIFSTDDVVGSAGVFKRNFRSVDSSLSLDQCATESDEIFHLNQRNARRVTDRNAPTVINAVFNFRQFWDGRANNAFNGETSWGARDPDAGVWMVKNGKPIKQRILLNNASLASQAVSPPTNDVEMSCNQRRLADVGRKLLQRRPLENQSVHPEDSVLGKLVETSGQGLSTTYENLIRKSFAKRYWKSEGEFGQSADGSHYSQMQANFGLFFGLSIMLYEQTLVSDQSLFDTRRDKDNVPVAFNDQQRRGLALFMKHQCVLCHLGPNLTSAAHPDVYNMPQGNKPIKLVDRSGFNEEGDGVDVAKTFVDVGYTITSVTPMDHDMGIAARDPWGHPLSFSGQYLEMMQAGTNSMIDGVDVLSCDFSLPFTTDFNGAELLPDKKTRRYCNGYEKLAVLVRPDRVNAELAKPYEGRLGSSIAAAFKVPTLRNVELTGPYMHNGSMKSLKEVIQFYNRGGNNVGNPHHFETLVFPQNMSESEQEDLIAFLKTLTDERVSSEKAPFDHPGIRVPHGHGNQGSAALGDQIAEDDYLIIPAVGRNGRSLEQGPLQSFEQALSH